MPRRYSRAQDGFTYIGLLFAIAVVSAAMAASVVVSSTMLRREKEEDLIMIGREVRNAIAAYYQSTPGTVKKYPPTLEALMYDARQAGTARYLRRIYRDPFTGKPEWGLIYAPQGGVMGIYSLSELTPLKSSFAGMELDFSSAKKYSDWRFAYLPPVQEELTSTTGNASGIRQEK